MQIFHIIQIHPTCRKIESYYLAPAGGKITRDLRYHENGTRQVPIALDLHDERIDKNSIGMAILGLLIHYQKGTFPLLFDYLLLFYVRPIQLDSKRLH